MTLPKRVIKMYICVLIITNWCYCKWHLVNWPWVVLSAPLHTVLSLRQEEYCECWWAERVYEAGRVFELTITHHPGPRDRYELSHMLSGFKALKPFVFIQQCVLCGCAYALFFSLYCICVLWSLHLYFSIVIRTGAFICKAAAAIFHKWCNYAQT